MDDQAIINRVRSGETEAFSQLIRRHQQMAFAIAMSIVKQESDARDAVQQAFLQSFTGLSGFKGKATFKTWLCRIVINEALRLIRRKKNTPEEEWSDEVAEAPPTVNEALANLCREDRAQFIRKIFSRMPPREAMVLHLFYLEDRSVKDTAYCTKLTTNHVKVLLSRGRNRFHALCQDSSGKASISEIL